MGEIEAGLNSSSGDRRQTPAKPVKTPSHHIKSRSRTTAQIPEERPGYQIMSINESEKPNSTT